MSNHLSNKVHPNLDPISMVKDNPPHNSILISMVRDNLTHNSIQRNLIINVPCILRILISSTSSRSRQVIFNRCLVCILVAVQLIANRLAWDHSERFILKKKCFATLVGKQNTNLYFKKNSERSSYHLKRIANLVFHALVLCESIVVIWPPINLPTNRSMLLCICSVIGHRWCQNVVRTKKWHMRCSQVCHWCSYHILTSSVIYYWTDTGQPGIYFFHIQ